MTPKTDRRFSLRNITLVGIVVALLIFEVAGLFSTSATPIERMELSARDLMMRLRGTQGMSGDIVIVAIDDFSFNWTGYQWPWPRSYFAGIVDQISKGGASVIGLDVNFFDQAENPADDEELAKALSKAPATVSLLQIFKTTTDGYTQATLKKPISIYRDLFTGLGLSGVTRDADTIVRNILISEAYDKERYYHWAFEIARLHLGVSPVKEENGQQLFNGQKLPSNDNLLFINYAGPTGTYPVYSASEVHDGVVLESNPDAFRGKIVLIGATTITLQDIFPTPFSITNPTPGVEIVANAIDTILQGKYLKTTPVWVRFAALIIAAGLALALTNIKRPTLTVSLMFALMLAYFGVGLYFFIQKLTYIPLASPEIMLFLGVVLPTLEQAVSQEAEKRRVRNLFSRFITPEMVDQMIETQDISSLNKRADLSIIFSDIRGFTTLSEKMTPEGVVALLNPYLEAMSRVIYKHGGTIDKYEGDAIIAFFGEPIPYKDHAERAVRAAMDMRIALDDLRKQWEKEGRPSQIEMGIGINTGEVFVGLLGSAQRINYTIIGDNANLASRLQDLTKTYSWPILISESTYQRVKDEFDTEFADAVTVKGKTKAVNVYKVLGKKGAKESERVQGWKL